MRVTSAARTLVDLARYASFESVVGAGDVAIRRHPALLADLGDVLARAHHQRGIGAARRALAFADGRCESPGESRLRVQLDRAGPQQVLADEKTREDALRELGWPVVRIVWSDLRDPEPLARRLREAMTRARRLTERGGPAGFVRQSAPLQFPQQYGR